MKMLNKFVASLSIAERQYLRLLLQEAEIGDNRIDMSPREIQQICEAMEVGYSFTFDPGCKCAVCQE